MVKGSGRRSRRTRRGVACGVGRGAADRRWHRPDRALSKALARRGFSPVHDRGRVLADTAVLIADGGTVMSDLATLRDQAELFGPVASDPTLWRTVDEIGPAQRERIGRARAKVRAHVWGLICDRHGRIPPSPVAERIWVARS